MVEVKGTLDELYHIFGEAAKGEARKVARRAGKKAVQKGTKKVTSAWTRFLKGFKFRKKRKNEDNRDYLAARSKAASRAYKRSKKGKK